MKDKFKILSIDGGGIRGVFPAMFLAKLEAELKSQKKENWQIYQNFDLICGTSTGGILAIALALGIPAQELYDLYLNNSEAIFGKNWKLLRFYKRWVKGLGWSVHNRNSLESLIREKFKSAYGNEDPRLDNCKTSVCVPIYDLLNGQPSVLKTRHNKAFKRDYHIPAFKAALATSAAPTYFDPYSSTYEDLNGLESPFSNKVDGGVVANNPTLIGILEAQEAFAVKHENLSVLSLGTGYQKFTDGKKRSRWGISYWLGKTRLIDLFMQAQSQLVENQISLIQNGIDKKHKDNPRFKYIRINTELSGSLKIALDETNPDKLKKLGEKAAFEFGNNGSRIVETFCK
ncbi:MAG: CBASS cGAMP-activated phospholipase [Reichenbachiella sp.]|uniref:CBASS cGAMP-activated phospholipase n=1 Tax=Reichenbachiella sp. TaxID=2184521 RepID=UPI003298478C